ncbi:hypothetical protein NONI108955_21180 [Nocardia ninae]|uniref:Uncharacterized protein n=1 Tax=Nocardia ninae NBRC 108245 TaxID=1210091 RepID=A0A511MBJ1_9NOCA|nr:hypothetical protein [Nocardia ninae]GEM37468.1 hypothetical protein NN4_19870 [Nocardia ninae NBRC 108245]
MDVMDSATGPFSPTVHVSVDHALLACCIFDPGPVGQAMATMILDLHARCTFAECVLRQRAQQLDDPSVIVASDDKCAVSDAEIADAVATVSVAKSLVRSAVAQQDQDALISATAMLVEALHARTMLFARACPARGWITTSMLHRFRLPPVEAEQIVRTLMRPRSVAHSTAT